MSKAENLIAAEPRNVFGDNASRRLRKEGLVPAVIYAAGEKAVAITIKADDWKVASARGSQIYTVELEGKEIPALVKEVQVNHLKNYVYHVDFQKVDLNAEIHATVPLHPIGEAYGAAHGGVLEQEVHELPVICRPSDLPELVKVDVSALNIGDTLTVAQLVLPAGVKTQLDPEAVVFHVLRPKEEAVETASADADAAPAQPEAINEQKAEARAAEKENKENK